MCLPCCKKNCNRIWKSKSQQKQLVISNMELHRLAPLQCSAAILKHQRFPVPGNGLIYLHCFPMWYRKRNVSRVELLDDSIRLLETNTANRNRCSWSFKDLALPSHNNLNSRKCGNTRQHLAYHKQPVHLPAPRDGIYGHPGLLQRSCTRNGHCALANAPIQGHLDRTKRESFS